jgi:hypothetical protein
LAPASTLVHRGVGSAPANSEGIVLAGYISHSSAQMVSFVLAGEGIALAGNISHPQAQMVPFVLADGLCRPPAEMHTTT